MPPSTSVPSQLKTVNTQPMQIEIIRDVHAWSKLAGEWNALLEKSHLRVPFLTYDFQRAWWDHLGGGEWENAELYIIAARNTQNRVIGIAPLFRVQDTDGKWTLRFIGTYEIADFLDLIVRPEDHEAFVQSLLETLSTDPDWQTLDLHNLIDTSRTTEILGALTVEDSMDFKVTPILPSPYIPIPSTMEEYFASLDSKQAHEMRRKLRRAAKNPETISTEIAAEKDQLDAALDDFFRLMSQELDKAQFLKPAMLAQMKAIAVSAFDAGWLQLFFLKSGDKRIAGYMNFDYDNCIWAYNAGFSNEYAELSPGWLLHAEMIRWCIEHGRKIFDFMRGGEEYKYRFGGINRFVQRVTITRLT